jgi:PEP-CTERM motif
MTGKHERLLGAAVLALGLGAASAAHAAISPGDGAAGNPPGEIFYTVWDPVNLVSYTRDTGISMLDFLADPAQSFSFAPDQLYTDTFGSADPGTLVYGVGGFNARFDDFPCCYGMLISSNGNNVGLPDVTALVTVLANGASYAIGANADAGDLTDFAANLSSISFPGAGGYYDGDYWGGNMGNTTPFQTGATVGVELAAYTLLLADDGFTVNTALLDNVFKLSADGTFSYGASVPAPAAIWLFGSALLGLAARRRRA